MTIASLIQIGAFLGALVVGAILGRSNVLKGLQDKLNMVQHSLNEAISLQVKLNEEKIAYLQAKNKELFEYNSVLKKQVEEIIVEKASWRMDALELSLKKTEVAELRKKVSDLEREIQLIKNGK